MKTTLHWAIFFGAFLLPSCVSSRNVPNLVTRGYLTEGQNTSPGYGGYAYLLLQPPDDAPSQYAKDSQRIAIMCATYHQYLLNYQQYLSTQGDNKKLMVIFYLLGRNGHFDVRQPCSDVLKTYDFSRSETIINSVPDHINAADNGPFLIAWDRPYESKDQPGSHCMVMNMSNFSDVDLSLALKIWIEYFAKDPNVWNEGLSYVLAKAEVHNFIVNYAGSITEFFKK